MAGPTNAAIDPKTDLRYYTYNDQQLLSVTSIRRQLGMPFNLANWQVSQVIKAAAAMRGNVASETMDDTEYGKHLRKMGMQQRDSAAKLGTSVHEAAEAGIKPVNLAKDDPRLPFLVQYEKWAATMKPIVHVQEAQVFNLTLKYAGSLDMIVEIDGHYYLVDLKTGKGTYVDHAVQLALYMGAEFCGGFDVQTNKDVAYKAQTEALQNVEGMAVLHLRPDSWEWIEIPFSDELAAAAVDMVHLAHFYGNHPTLDSLVDASRSQKGA